MNRLWDNLTKFFTQPPTVFTGFYLSSHYFCGVCFSDKERKAGGSYFKALPKDVIRPSLNEKNIVEPEALKQEFSEALDQMDIHTKNVALVFPELSQKTFIFSFDSLPGSPQEREQIIRFRIKKRLPFLPEDARISYDLISKDSGVRAVAILTRKYIVKEYEDFFAQFNLKVRKAVPPSVGLINLLNMKLYQDYFLVNIEPDSFSLSSYIDSEFILYRQKRFNLDSKGTASLPDLIEGVFKEVETTLNFIEGAEGKRDLRFLIRCGSKDIKKLLESSEVPLDFSFERIGSVLDLDFDLEETEILSPVLGMLL